MSGPGRSAARRLMLMGSKFSPAALSPVLWLKADAGLFQDSAKTTPATADADPVGAWADQSGNGRDLTQATAASRPTLKLAVQNGLNVVRTDGVDDVLTQLALNPVPPFTVYVVCQSAAVAVASGLVGFNRSGGGFAQGGLLRTTATNYQVPVQNGAASVLTLNGAPPTPNAWHIFTTSFTGDPTTFSGQLLEDGTSVVGPTAATGVFDSSAVNRDFTVGCSTKAAGQPIAADYGEVLVFSRTLLAAEDTQLRAYLKTRWGTP